MTNKPIIDNIWGFFSKGNRADPQREPGCTGKPVIGPNYGAPTEFIRHGEHGLLVNPESPEEVAEALIQMLSSPDLARQMGEAARQWVLQEYSYPRFRERLGRILGIRGV